MASHAPKRVTLDEIWPELETGVHQLITNLNQGFPRQKWMQLYSNVYNYCTTSRPSNTGRGSSGVKGLTGASFVGEELYNKLKDFLTTHMKGLAKSAESKMDEGLLNYYHTEWIRYTTAMKYINHIFQYLNRHWIKREADDGKKTVYEIYILSLVIWRDHFFMGVKNRLTNSILTLIEKERNGEQIDTTLVAGVISGYVSLGLNKDKPKETTLEVYKDHFEKEFLLHTENYYTAEAGEFIEENSISDYMKKVEVRLEEELGRVRHYLHVSTEQELIRNCETVLISKHMERIWTEFQSMLEDDKIEDLSRMFRILERVPRGLDPLKSALEKHVHNMGLQAVQDVVSTAINDPKVFVDAVLKVWRKFNELVVKAFSNDSGFVGSLDKACRRFINDNAVCQQAKSASKSPELLARFTDLLLKKSSHTPEESQMDELLNDVMTVFKYIEDKDVFQTFYSKMLAKRLIHGTSASEDLEASMIGKIKSTCGYEYTSKLQRMFTDMSVSRDLLDKFKYDLEKNNTEIKIDFSVLVLATGSWPLAAPSTSFITPTELESCEKLFFKFYQTQHTGRKLNWLHQLSKGELKTGYLTTSKVGYVFQASTYQMAVLLQFNHTTENSLTFEEVRVNTDMKENFLKQTLLTLHKAKVVHLDDPNKIGTISLNKSYKSKRTKVNINVAVPQQVQEESDQTHKFVEEDRKLQIQAAIVRIMKTRKTLSHTNLITEVIEQLKNRFKPKILLIKKCIDLLIEKEYLERGEGKKDQYSYIA